jgi:hypothetical protein
MVEKGESSQHTEIILAFPTLEIILKVTEIHCLDVFYNPLHKAIIRRQRKRRRVETPQI